MASPELPGGFARHFGGDVMFEPTTFELALWCKLLRDRGKTGAQIARALTKSEGYINNLIRVIERSSIAVLGRWRAEQLTAAAPPVCATDWLMQVCLLPHDRQDDELARRLAAAGL